MAVNLSPVGGVAAQFFDNSGNVLTGGKLFTYAAGTTTPVATFTSSLGTTAHTNPIVLDAAGRVPNGGEIWLTDGVTYKFALQTSTNVLIATYDNITGINSNFVNFTAEQEIQTATAGQTVFNLTTMQYQPGTNSLTVYVDGVNQYGPGAQYAYLETDSDTVTFVSGLHVGASVKFTTAVQATGNATNASVVTYDPPFTGGVATNVEDKLAQTVSVKDFGAVGDGVTDDTLAIQNGINYVATNGGTLYFSTGTYRLTALLGVNAAAKPFTLLGYSTATLVRSADYGSMLSINNSNNWVVQGLNFDGKFSTYSVNANHGIVWSNCSEIRVVNCKVVDYKNSGIIGFTFPESSSYYDNQIINCVVDGLNNANNGILLADLVRSGLTDCQALNIGKTGSPCYALQLKNGCQEGWIKGGIATGASIGIAAGNAGTIKHTKNIITGINVFDCETGIAFGNIEGDLFSDLVIDMNNQGQNAVDMNLNTVGCVGQNIAVHNLAANKYAVNFRSGDTDNVVKIASISNSTGLVRPAAQFLAGAERNTAQLDRYVNPTTVTSTTTLVTNLSGVSTNRFDYGALPTRSSLVIASDAITLFGPSVSAITVDTEGAAATDDLVTINGGADAQTITIKTASNLRDVTVVNSTSGANTIRLAGGVNFTLTTVADKLVLQYDGVLQQWCELSRADNL